MIRLTILACVLWTGPAFADCRVYYIPEERAACEARERGIYRAPERSIADEMEEDLRARRARAERERELDDAEEDGRLQCLMGGC